MIFPNISLILLYTAADLFCYHHCKVSNCSFRICHIIIIFFYYFIFILECLCFSVVWYIVYDMCLLSFFHRLVSSTPGLRHLLIFRQATMHFMSVCSAKLKFKISKQGLVLSFHQIYSFPCGLLDRPNTKYLWHLSLLASLYSGFRMQHSAKLVLCMILPLN